MQNEISRMNISHGDLSYNIAKKNNILKNLKKVKDHHLECKEPDSTMTLLHITNLYFPMYKDKYNNDKRFVELKKLLKKDNIIENDSSFNLKTYIENYIKYIRHEYF